MCPKAVYPLPLYFQMPHKTVLFKKHNFINSEAINIAQKTIRQMYGSGF